MKAIGYVRVSKRDRDKTEEQQRLSIRQQTEVIGAACDQKGWTLLRVVEDFALSGNDDTRPGYSEVADAVAAREADIVVVRHVDRLYRKGWRLLRLVDPVAEGGDGWNVFSVEQAFDTTTAAGWYAFAQFALFGDFERRMISDRTRQALAQKKREGIHCGRPSLIPTPVEDRIFQLHSGGLSATRIAALLEAEGTPRPTENSKSWHHSHVLAAVRRVETRRQAS